jgi:hypothetical protein
MNIRENCRVEINEHRGVIYIDDKQGMVVIRISGLTPEQCKCDHIDVRAEQPRSHNETLYGWNNQGSVPEHLKRK